MRKRRWLAFVLATFGLACHQHEGSSERDTKGRAEATLSTRDQTMVETGDVTLAWSGTITESKGKAPAIGTPCTHSRRACTAHRTTT